MTVGGFGSATGSLSVTPTTGTGPYTYRLGTSGAFVSANSFTNLRGGSYRVYIQDANGCIGNVTVVIGQSAAITGTISVTNVTGCSGGTNGAISVTPTTGTAPYTFRLGTTGAYGNNSNFTGLRAGNYIIYIQDANGCIGSRSVAVLQPVILGQTFSINNVTCNGGTNGAITVTGTGGTTPYSYRLGTSGAFSSTNTFTGLRAGSYRVYIQDANGCAFNSSAVVAEPTDVSIFFAKTDLTCFASNDGTITLTGLGGTPPYTFRLGTVGGYSTTNSFASLKPGNYRAYVQDANGCSGGSVPVNIAQSIDPCNPGISKSGKAAIATNSNQLTLNISPNQSNGRFTLTTHAESKIPLAIRVLDVNGKSVYATKGTPEQTFKFGESLMTGTYLVEVRQGNDVKTVKAVKQ